MADVNAFNIFL